MADKITGLLGDYRPVNERIKDVPGAVRRYMQKSLLLDSPEMTGSETAADIALGFVPGLGTAMGVRDFERARRDGDGLGMALGAVGLLPVVGGAAQLVKKGGKAGKAADGAGYDMAKIANNYPDTAPPVLATDPKTGKEFLQKQNSAEAQAVEKARKAAQKDIDKGNYTPFFDVSKRTYADPNNYPLQGRTVTDALPKKQDTIDKYAAMFDTPEARARLTQAYREGSQDPLAKDWYALGQLENEFVKEFGDQKGREMFKERFAQSMAATTGGADPTSNLLMGNYGNFLRQKGVAQPTAAYEFPYPIGGRFASGNMAMYDKVINQGKDLSAVDTPKRFDFAANFMGHRDRATIDEQMSGGFQPGLLAPPGNSYGVMEGVVHDLASKEGVMPANFQDVAWKGLKGVPGKPMIQHVNEAIERTSRVTGKAPQDVVRDSLVRGTHPLYGVGGAGLLGGLLGYGQDDSQ